MYVALGAVVPPLLTEGRQGPQVSYQRIQRGALHNPGLHMLQCLLDCLPLLLSLGQSCALQPPEVLWEWNEFFQQGRLLHGHPTQLRAAEGPAEAPPSFAAGSCFA